MKNDINEFFLFFFLKLFKFYDFVSYYSIVIEFEERVEFDCIIN